MARSIPAAFLTELTASVCRPLFLFELELSDGTIYLSSQAVTWNGQAYDALAISCSEIKESDDASINQFTLRLSNVTAALRTKLEPIDKLTDGRLTVRLVMRDAAWAFITGSYIVFRGFLERPRNVSESTFELMATPLTFQTSPVPQRRTSEWCQARFKDAIDCNYVGVLTTCNRQFLSADGCSGRSRQHEFLGFRGVSLLRPFFGVPGGRGVTISSDDPRYTPAAPPNHPTKPGQPGFPYNPPLLGEPERDVIDPATSVPILLGRRLLRGILVEEGHASWNSRAYLLRWYLLTEGQIDSIQAWLSDKQIQENVYAAGKIELGMWYRDGGIGIAALDSSPENQGAAVLRDQNQDYWSPLLVSLVDGSQWSAYSRSAYATFVQRISEKDFIPIDDVAFDTRGVKIGIYDGSGNLLSTSYSANPIWEVVWICLHHRGLGRLMTTADIDWPVGVASAGVCDVELASDEAVTTVATAVTASEVLPVVRAAGFFRGQRVLVSGVSSRTVVDAVEGRLTLSAAVTALQGDAVQGYTQRFESHIYLPAARGATDQIAQILGTCRGFRTFDNGKVQLRIAQTQGTVQAHFRDVDFAAGYGILAGSFRWLLPDRNKDVNRVRVRFDNAALDFGDDEVTETNWDHLDTHQENYLTLDLPGINNRDQAHRIAAYELDRYRLLQTGAEFIVGPIGLKLQPGDRIQVTHAVPNWSARDCIIRAIEIIGLGDQDEFCVKLAIDEYNAAAFPDSGLGDGYVPAVPLPTVTLMIQNATPGYVYLTWTPSSRLGLDHWSLYRGHGTFGSPPTPALLDRIGVLRADQRSFVYSLRETDDDLSLYFVLRGVRSVGADIWSNEISLAPIEVRDAGPGVNMVDGGDFNDPVQWEQIAPATALIYPNAQSTNPDDDASFANIANAYDADMDTYATGVYSLSGGIETSAGNIFTFASGPAMLARAVARIQHMPDVGSAGGGWEFHYKIGAGSWTQVAADSGTGKGIVWVYGPYVSLTDPNTLSLRVRARPFARTASCSGSVRLYSSHAEQQGAPPYAVVSGNIAQFKAVDTSTWVVLSRPFPGRAPQRVNVALRAGQSYVIQLQVHRGSGAAAPDGPFEVCLWDADYKWTTESAVTTVLRLDGTPRAGESGTDYDLVLDSWRVFATRIIPATNIAGNLRLLLRSKSTQVLGVDRLDIRPGQALLPAGPSAAEQLGGYFWDSDRPLPISGIRTRLLAGPDEFVVLETA